MVFLEPYLIYGDFLLGISQGDLFRHYLFAIEFTIKYVACEICECSACAGSDTQKLLIVLDAKGIGMRDMGGESAEFIRRCITVMQKHYPQRSYKIYLVNVPTWFGMIWKGIKPLLNDATRAKTNIVAESDTPSALLECISAENLPVEYGGKCACIGGCEENSLYQQNQRALVESIGNCTPYSPANVPMQSPDPTLLSECAPTEELDEFYLDGNNTASPTHGLIPPGSFRDEVVKAGYLLQRSFKHKHFNPIWYRRFFILHRTLPVPGFRCLPLSTCVH